MKNTASVFVLFVFLSFCPDIYSLDTAASKYYPLTTGNLYVYKSSDFSIGGSSTVYFKIRIENDSVFNSHRYYKLITLPENTVKWRRVDSLTNNIMQYDPANSCPYYYYEKFVDSLSSRINNYETGVCNSMMYQCSDTGYTVILGMPSQNKGFSFSVAHYNSSKKYAKNIGFHYSSYYSGGAGGSTGSTTLLGCILNGVVYGDTTMPLTGVHQLSAEIPGAFSLMQNYPNPFNPVTKIQFDVPFSSTVKITVYDIAGRIVSVLADEELSPSVYSVDVDASQMASGVYIYRMEAQSIENGSYFSQSKKMVVIK
jgi:hypothetical protein